MTCDTEGENRHSVIFTQIHFNLGIPGLGGHRLQSLSTFYNVVKKLAHFEFAQLLIGFDLFFVGFYVF